MKAPQVGELVARMTPLEFVSGKLTAAGQAQGAKTNSILKWTQESQRLGDIVRGSLLRNTLLQNYALPKKVFEPEFSKYDAGMQYGLHCDAGLFNPFAANALRTDLSVTLFLSAASDYDGGELRLKHNAGEARIKADIGDAVVYPSTFLHEVTRITRGCRLVAVTWIESHVRSHEARSVLYELSCIAADLSEDLHTRSDTKLQLSRTYNNLVRLFADT